MVEKFYATPLLCLTQNGMKTKTLVLKKVQKGTFFPPFLLGLLMGPTPRDHLRVPIIDGEGDIALV